MPRPPRTREKTRLNLELSKSVRERLDHLKDLSDADSLTEVIRRAAAVYEVLLEQREEGAETIVRYKDGRERMVLLP